MKFITEIDLRNLYKDEPFTVYNINSNIRLTPGARQFLLDRKIEILNNDFHEKKNIIEKQEPFMESKDKEDWRKNKLITKLNSVEALFFIIVEETLDRNLILAQEIIELSKVITGMKRALKYNTPIKDIHLNQFIKIDEEIPSQEIELDFDITDFHIQLERGRDILNLHRLRCLLEEIEPIVYQLWEYDDENIELYQNIIVNVNQVVNSLSQKIYCILGGVKC